MQPTERHRSTDADMVFRGAELLKPTKQKPGGDAELLWYERVTRAGSPFVPFIPRFLGREDVNGVPYIRMENVLHAYSHPSLMDMKLGSRTYPPNAPQDKIDYELWKYPRQSESGYRMAGVRVYDSVSDSYRSYTKRECQSFAPESLEELLRAFFRLPEPGGASPSPGPRALVRRVQAALLPLLELFRVQREFHFTASSVLIVYERLSEKEEGEEDYRVDVRFIDFFYAIPGEGTVDENTLFGLERVCADLQRLIA